ncbi:MAG: 50S ribosomal protein L23 [Gemmataceae bacterium]
MRPRPKPKKYQRKLMLRQPCEHGPTGLQLESHQVLLRPLVTEKGTLQSTKFNSYTFQVNPLATKAQIKSAVQEMFKVRVDKVRTQIYMGKTARYRGLEGKQADWKKAVVTLHEEDKIDFF